MSGIEMSQSFGSLTDYPAPASGKELSTGSLPNADEYFRKKSINNSRGDIAQQHALDDISPLARYDRPLLPAPSMGYLDSFKSLFNDTSQENKMSAAETNSSATQEAGSSETNGSTADPRLEMLKQNAIKVDIPFDLQLHMLPNMGNRGAITDTIA